MSEKELAKDPSRGVLNERGGTHGDFEENGAVMQALKEVMRDHWKWGRLSPFKREALEMIQHKIGRILCGDDNFYDHWRDISGYARLCEERCPKPRKLRPEHARQHRDDGGSVGFSPPGPTETERAERSRINSERIAAKARINAMPPPPLPINKDD